jgi:hypothetical protein
MARRVNPIPNETPKYWRIPIVASIAKRLYLWVGKRREKRWVITIFHMEREGARSWNLVLFGLAELVRQDSGPGVYEVRATTIHLPGAENEPPLARSKASTALITT